MTEPNIIQHIDLHQSPLKNVVTIKSQLTPLTVSSGNTTPINSQANCNLNFDNIAKIVQKNSPQETVVKQYNPQPLQNVCKENSDIRAGTLSNLTAIINTVDTAANSCFDRETPTPSIIKEYKHNIIKMIDESVSGRNYPMKSHIKDNSGKNILQNGNSNSNSSNNLLSNVNDINTNDNDNKTKTFSYYLQQNTNTFFNDKDADKAQNCKVNKLPQQIQEQEEENEQFNYCNSNMNMNSKFKYDINEKNDYNSETVKENYFNKEFDYQLTKKFNSRNNNSNNSNNNPNRLKGTTTNNNMNSTNNKMMFNINSNMNIVSPNYIDYNKSNTNDQHHFNQKLKHHIGNQINQAFNQTNQLVNQYSNKTNGMYNINCTKGDEMMAIQHKMSQMHFGQDIDPTNNCSYWNQPNMDPNSIHSYNLMKMQLGINNNNPFQEIYNNNPYATNQKPNYNHNDYIQNQQLFQINPFGVGNHFNNNYSLTGNFNPNSQHNQFPIAKNKLKTQSQSINNLNISELIKNSNAICKDQSNCRLLQKKIEEDPSITQEIIENAFDNVIEMIIDPFGNYLIQKLFDYMQHEQFCQLMALIQTDIYQICCNSFGTRVIQKLIDFLTTETLIQTFVTLIRSIIKDIMQDINGGHVLLKSIELANPSALKVIYNEICLNIVFIASHKHGCCVLQKSIERAHPITKQQLVSYLLMNCRKLILDQCGNYIIQYIITLQDEVIQSKIADQLSSDILAYSKQKYSSNVVEKCFECCNHQICNKLLLAMKNDKICIELLFDKFGNYVLQKALVRADEETQQFILTAIAPSLEKLKKYPFGVKLYFKLLNTYAILSSVMLYKTNLSQKDCYVESFGAEVEVEGGDGEEVEEDNGDECLEGYNDSYNNGNFYPNANTMNK